MPYKIGQKWMAQTRIDGKKKVKRFNNKAEAKAWEVQQRAAEGANPQPIPRKTDTISLGFWANVYLDYAKNKFIHKTYDEKQSVFRRFFLMVSPIIHVENLTSGMILDYLQKQFNLRSGYAANKDRKNLIAAWNWGIKYLGLPSTNPCQVDRFPEQRETRYVPPERDFWKVHEATLTDQDKVMLLAYFHLAARRSELFGLKWQDVDFAGQKVRLYTRKRQDGSLEPDWLPMTDHLHEALLAHKQKDTNEWVFPEPESGLPYTNRQHWMKRLCKRAGVKAFGIHAIRHLTASFLAKENVPMIDIQTILRHKSLATTERYIRRIADLRPTLRVLPGGKSPQTEAKAHSLKEKESQPA